MTIDYSRSINLKQFPFRRVKYKNKSLICQEKVKSGRKTTTLPGMDAFAKAYPVQKELLIGRKWG